MNASRDGRIVVAAHGDGTIRWYRADDGRELLALQVLLNKSEPSKSDWVLWTPEGFYEATPGAQDVLKMGRQSWPREGRDDASGLSHPQAASTKCAAACSRRT